MLRLNNLKIPILNKLKTLEAEGFPARFVLSFIASAGILYANLTPVIISGLAQSANYTSETAGYIFSANMLGTALGGLFITFYVTKLAWRPVAMFLLVLLIFADIISVFVVGETWLSLSRFFHGLIGGALIGLSFSVIARVRKPEQTFAILIFVQLGIGGVGTAILTALIPTMGMGVLWLSLAGFSIVSLMLLPLLDAYPVRGVEGVNMPTELTQPIAPLLMICFTLIALFCFQSGQLAAFAYVIELGKHYAFETNFISLSVASSLWVGAPAALLVAWWSTRSGRLKPVLLGMIFLIISVGILLVPKEIAYLGGNIGFGIFYSLSIPYLLGIASELDETGKTAAIASFVGSMGLAAGPAIGALIVGQGQVAQVIYFAVFALVLSAVLFSFPARFLDRQSR